MVPSVNLPASPVLGTSGSALRPESSALSEMKELLSVLSTRLMALEARDPVAGPSKHQADVFEDEEMDFCPPMKCLRPSHRLG